MSLTQPKTLEVGGVSTTTGLGLPIGNIKRRWTIFFKLRIHSLSRSPALNSVLHIMDTMGKIVSQHGQARGERRPANKPGTAGRASPR